MRLLDGADAIRGDLPASATIQVDVPSGAGHDEGTGVHRLSSIVAVRDSLEEVLPDAVGLPIVIGGDCGVELAAISAAVSNGSTAVLWLDAHPDLNSEESSPSGAFHGMVLRTLLGDGVEALVPTVALTPGHLVLGGTRAFDDAELDYATAAELVVIRGDDLSAETVANALRATGATSVYVHVDLDVLDPRFITGVGFPEPFGISLPLLIEVITAAKQTLPLVGAGVTEFAPTSSAAANDDLGSILRIIGALAS